MIKYYEGDIFSSNADLICHQVNCQGVFGRGMAGQVKKLFGVTPQSHQTALDAMRACQFTIV